MSYLSEIILDLNLSHGHFQEAGGRLLEAERRLLEAESLVLGMAWRDYDQDGDLDLFLTDFDGGNSLFRNESKGSHYLAMRLEGHVPNRFGVGATVRVLASSRWQTRMASALESGSSGQAVVFHPPSMRFARDGKRLVVSDFNVWVWVVGWE